MEEKPVGQRPVIVVKANTFLLHYDDTAEVEEICSIYCTVHEDREALVVSRQTLERFGNSVGFLAGLLRLQGMLVASVSQM